MKNKQLSIRSKIQLLYQLQKMNHFNDYSNRTIRRQSGYNFSDAFQDQQIDFYLNFYDQSQEKIVENISPPFGKVAKPQETSSEQVSNNQTFKTLFDQSSELPQFSPQQKKTSNDEFLQQIIDGNTPKKKAKKRNDGNDFAQNNSSCARSMVCKIMSRQRTKDWKKLIKDDYDKFLKESQVTNSQIVLVFTYLFLIKAKASEWIYSQFKYNFIEHLTQVRSKAEKNPDKKMRSALIVKIEANIQLVQYIFGLKGQEEINFEYVKTICEPLFTGRQAKTIEKPISKAIKIQSELLAAGNTTPCSYTFPSDRKTSNTSTGIQVEL